MSKCFPLKMVAHSFRGEKLLDALRLQTALQAVPQAATKLATLGKVLSLKKGTIFIEEGTYTTDIFLYCAARLK